MRTKPHPNSMFNIVGGRGYRVHLGYRENENVRPLCGAALSKKFLESKIARNKKTNCKFCLIRLKRIQKAIKKLGVEWVCEGRWLPMEQRTFSVG